jgi:hypothetical protein
MISVMLLHAPLLQAGVGNMAPPTGRDVLTEKMAQLKLNWMDIQTEILN